MNLENGTWILREIWEGRNCIDCFRSSEDKYGIWCLGSKASKEALAY